MASHTCQTLEEHLKEKFSYIWDLSREDIFKLKEERHEELKGMEDVDEEKASESLAILLRNGEIYAEDKSDMFKYIKETNSLSIGDVLKENTEEERQRLQRLGISLGHYARGLLDFINSEKPYPFTFIHIRTDEGVVPHNYQLSSLITRSGIKPKEDYSKFLPEDTLEDGKRFLCHVTKEDASTFIMKEIWDSHHQGDELYFTCVCVYSDVSPKEEDMVSKRYGEVLKSIDDPESSVLYYIVPIGYPRKRAFASLSKKKDKKYKFVTIFGFISV